MASWKFVKEEPGDDKSYKDESDYYEIFDSYPTLKSEQSYDVKIESRGEFYSTFESKQSCDAEIDCEEKKFKEEENNNQDTWKTKSSYCPESPIPLERIEYSQNQEIIKYLKHPQPEVTSSNSLLSGNQTIELNLNLKTESVELETLTENTLVQSPAKCHYASPWDFVAVPSIGDQNSSKNNAIKTEFGSNNLSNKIVKKDHDGETFNESFTCKSPFPRGTAKIQKANVLKKKFIQKTLNFEVGGKQRKDESTITKAPVQLSNCNCSKHSSKPQPRSSDSKSPPDESFFCKLCNIYFSKNSKLKQHRCNQLNDEDPEPARSDEEIHRSGKNFACKVCGRPGKLMSELRRHCATHQATKRYECDTCKKKFKRKEYLHQHRLAHNTEQYPCNNCSRVYRRKSTLRRHVNTRCAGTAKIIKCTPRTHVAELGSKIDKNNGKPATEAPLKLYKCDVCGQGFEDKSNMRVHIEFLHIEIFGEPAAKAQPRFFNTLSNKPYQCRTCKKRYTQLSHLKRHQESHLSNKSHICTFCDQNFTTTSSLTRHLYNKHNEVRSMRKRNALDKMKKTPKDFTCKICDRALTNLGDLRRHCATHDARKPFECDICKKQFAVKGYLYAHILTHDNWKPYPCQKCSKVYRRKSSLQRHIQISHSGKKKNRNAEFA